MSTTPMETGAPAATTPPTTTADIMVPRSLRCWGPNPTTRCPNHCLHFRECKEADSEDRCGGCTCPANRHATDGDIEVQEDVLMTGSSRKRGQSQPGPRAVTASLWTSVVLEQLQIVIVGSSKEEVLSCGEQSIKLNMSDRAQQLIKEFKAITPWVASNVFVGAPIPMLDEAGQTLNVDPAVVRGRGGVCWALMKYLALITMPITIKGKVKLAPEGIVDDFFIHLLVALGFNDGDLVILSKNDLKLTMNRSTTTKAEADITVFDIKTRLRLVVVEDKPLLEPEKGRVDAEAQLVAEAIAAAQSNAEIQSMTYQSTKKKSIAEASARSRSVSAESAVGSSGPRGPDLRPVGAIFMIRLIGTTFSFYSVNPTMQFLGEFADYNELQGPNQFQPTVVFKYQLNDGGKDAFDFLEPTERPFVIEMLDLFRQRMLV